MSATPSSFLGPFQLPVVSRTVRVSGLAPVNANILNVNLQCGPSVFPRDDVAFHLSILFDRLTVIMNSISDYQWGPPKPYIGQFPFQRGQEFSFDIICEEYAFQVVMNGMSTTRFEHRVEPSRISHLAIDGDVMLWAVELLEGNQVVMRFGVTPSNTTGLNPDGMPPTSPIQYSVPYLQQPGPFPQLPGQQRAFYFQQPENRGPPGSFAQHAETQHLATQQLHTNVSQPAFTQLSSQWAETLASPTTSSSQLSTKKSLLDVVNLKSLRGVVGSAAAAAAVLGKKGAKELEKLSMKAQKKALKYGISMAEDGHGASIEKPSRKTSGSSH